jgi:pyruvate ferredoxin oxidoreductase alpha subunit
MPQGSNHHETGGEVDAGNYEGIAAVAEAVRLCRPQVVSAYPITPQTHIVEALAQYVADCTLDAEYITVENELSALSACVGASAAGSRTYSATTSQGLALMFEVCFNAAGLRLPIVMSIANRALGAPLSIWNDHRTQSHSGCRLAAVLAEDNQEATDLLFLAYRVSDRISRQLPRLYASMVSFFSHTYEPVDVLSQEQVDSFLPNFSPDERLVQKTPSASACMPRRNLHEFRTKMDRPRNGQGYYRKDRQEFVLPSEGDYSGLVEANRLDDAETAIVAMGSVCARLRMQSMKCGMRGKKSDSCESDFPTIPVRRDPQKCLRGSNSRRSGKNISLGAKGATAWKCGMPCTVPLSRSRDTSSLLGGGRISASGISRNLFHFARKGSAISSLVSEGVI